MFVFLISLFIIKKELIKMGKQHRMITLDNEVNIELEKLEINVSDLINTLLKGWLLAQKVMVDEVKEANDIIKYEVSYKEWYDLLSEADYLNLVGDDNLLRKLTSEGIIKRYGHYEEDKLLKYLAYKFPSKRIKELQEKANNGGITIEEIDELKRLQKAYKREE